MQARAVSVDLLPLVKTGRGGLEGTRHGESLRSDSGGRLCDQKSKREKWRNPHPLTPTPDKARVAVGIKFSAQRAEEA